MAYAATPPTVTGEHASLEMRRGLAGKRLELDKGEAHSASLNRNMRARMRWPCGGGGFGGKVPQSSLNDMLLARS